MNSFQAQRENDSFKWTIQTVIDPEDGTIASDQTVYMNGEIYPIGALLEQIEAETAFNFFKGGPIKDDIKRDDDQDEIIEVFAEEET